MKFFFRITQKCLSLLSLSLSLQHNTQRVRIVGTAVRTAHGDVPRRRPGPSAHCHRLEWWQCVSRSFFRPTAVSGPSVLPLVVSHATVRGD